MYKLKDFDRENTRDSSLMPEIIVDNFLSNPDKIRDIALSSQFRDCNSSPLGGSWPGLRSDFVSDLIPKDEYTSMIGGMLDQFLGQGDYYASSYFQLCYNIDSKDRWIHQDIDFRYASIIYLTPSPEKASGTELYTPITMGYEAYHPHKESNYNLDRVIENKYNRLAIYDANEFHTAGEYFGEDKDSARLTIITFFNLK
jgi:hypothetical protein